MLSAVGNIDKVGRYGGARIYIPSKVAFDSALPFKMGEEVKIEISPQSKTLLVAPANDERNFAVIDVETLKENQVNTGINGRDEFNGKYQDALEESARNQ